MKISIITVTYNSASTLKDTLNSVLMQDYYDYEHIVVDGGSIDATIEIVKGYEHQYNGRLKWISERDKGIYDAMNKGIEMVSGDIVGILNSDDFLSSDAVFTKINKEFTEGIEAVYANLHFVSPNNLTKSVRCYSSKYFKPWQMRYGFMPPHPTFYCLKRVYDKYGHYDIQFRNVADFDFILRVIFINKIKTKYIDSDFVTMRIGGASTSGLASYSNAIKERLRIFKKNRVYSNVLFIFCVYIVKTIDYILKKIKNVF